MHKAAFATPIILLALSLSLLGCGGGGGGGGLEQIVLSFLSPAVGARTVPQGTVVVLSVTVTSSTEIARVQFTDNGTAIGTVRTPVDGAYGLNWNTTGLPLGEHTIVATAFDRSSPVRTGTATITITLQAPPQPAPTVQIDSPTGGTVSWNMNVSASAQARAAGATITRISVTFGGVTRVISGTGGATLSGTVAFDTTAVSDGAQTITATALDSNGRTATATVTVTVNNSTTPPPPPF